MNYFKSLYLEYITSSKEKKRKIFLIFWSIVVLLLISLFFFIKKDTASVTNIKNPSDISTDNTTIEESTSINENINVNSIEDTQVKTSLITLREDIINELQDDSIIKWNYDLKQLISVSGLENLTSVILKFLTLDEINNKDIEEINSFFKNIKVNLTLENCKEQICTLDEKLWLFQKLQSFNLELSGKKTEVIQSSYDFSKYSNLKSFENYLNLKYICSETDIINKYLLKLRLEKSKKNIEDEIKEFKDLFLLNSSLFNYNLQLDNILTSTYIEIKYSELKNILSSNKLNYQVQFWDSLRTITYYNYKWKNIEEEVIKWLENLSNSSLYNVIGNKNITFILKADYIETVKWKQKIYTPQIEKIENLSLVDTLTYLYLSYNKDNCNHSDKLIFSNYSKDVNEKEILKNYIKFYEENKTLIFSWQVSDDDIKKNWILLTEYKLLFNSIFTN